VFLGTDLGIDLGTATVLVFLRGKGVVLKEPSVVAIDRDSGKVLAIGEEARRMVGRTPGNIVAVRPLREGVIADFDVTETMLRYFISRACGRRMFFRPRVIICIPPEITGVERRAVLDAASRAGAGKVFPIEQPLAAAIGAGLDITQPSGNMVVDIGGGTTDIAIISLGGVVVSQSLRVAGDKFDDALIRYVKREFDLAIGERTAEELKMQVGTAHPEGRDATTQIRGRDLITGLPKTITVTSRDCLKAFKEPLAQMLDAIHSVLERTPPELAADIMDKGLVLTGGGSLLESLDRLIRDETGVPVHQIEDPVSCVALGAGKALEHFQVFTDHIEPLRRTGGR
jgi:rod shape-determining protein MreB and related proteins